MLIQIEFDPGHLTAFPKRSVSSLSFHYFFATMAVDQGEKN
jgi:hypothetical protein